MTSPTLYLTPTQSASPIRSPPVFPSLKFVYSPSPDKTDSNLLILFHGLGDTSAPFANLAKSLNLPQTATLSLQAPTRIPLLEEDAWQWWESFNEVGEMIPNPNPSSTLSKLTSFLDYLSQSPSGPRWPSSSIHLFGFSQGGSCAAELALALAKSHPQAQFGSVISVGGALLSFPTLSKKIDGIRVLLVYRKAEERLMGIAGFKKGFENVEEVVLPRDQGQGGMPRGRDEWTGIMKFWVENLTRRSALEFGKDVFEVVGGTAAGRESGGGKN